MLFNRYVCLHRNSGWRHPKGMQWRTNRRSATGRKPQLAELSRDLALIARRHGLDVLGYLLEMARLEAENVTRHMNGRN
jgi:hypothetical protein